MHKWRFLCCLLGLSLLLNVLITVFLLLKILPEVKSLESRLVITDIIAKSPCGLGMSDRIFQLEEFDKDAYLIAKEIANHPLLQLQDTKFFLNCDELTAAQGARVVLDTKGNLVNAVYFSPLTIQSQHFRAIVAHELAHIHLKHRRENRLIQQEADRFAARVVGEKAVREWRASANPGLSVILVE